MIPKAKERRVASRLKRHIRTWCRWVTKDKSANKVISVKRGRKEIDIA